MKPIRARIVGIQQKKKNVLNAVAMSLTKIKGALFDFRTLCTLRPYQFLALLFLAGSLGIVLGLFLHYGLDYPIFALGLIALFLCLVVLVFPFLESSPPLPCLAPKGRTLLQVYRC